MNQDNGLVEKLMTEMGKAQTGIVCFDCSHNNKLTIGSSFSDFTYDLTNSFKVAQIVDKDSITAKKLREYNLFVIGGPANSVFTGQEIDAIESYVREGGGLLIANSDSVNYESVNLNDLACRLGFKFNSDKLFYDLQKDEDKNKPIIFPHPVTNNVKRFTYTQGCSIDINEDSGENVKASVIGKSGTYCLARELNGSKVSASNKAVLVAVNYHKGRVIGLGNLSMFSSSNMFHGYSSGVLDNKVLVSNMITWLVNSGNEFDLEALIMSIPSELSSWIKHVVKEEEYWVNPSDFISFALGYLKSNFDKVKDDSKEYLTKVLEKRKQKADEQIKPDKIEQAAVVNLVNHDDSKLDSFGEDEPDERDKAFNELQEMLNKNKH